MYFSSVTANHGKPGLIYHINIFMPEDKNKIIHIFGNN